LLRPSPLDDSNEDDSDGGPGESTPGRQGRPKRANDVHDAKIDAGDEEEEAEEDAPEEGGEEEHKPRRAPRGRSGSRNRAADPGTQQQEQGGREKVSKEEKLRRVLQGRLGQGFTMPESEKTAFVDDMMDYLLRDWHRADFKPLRGHHH
jgi:hypothetical protein